MHKQLVCVLHQFVTTDQIHRVTAEVTAQHVFVPGTMDHGLAWGKSVQ